MYVYFGYFTPGHSIYALVSKTELPLAPVRRILDNANAERVSDEAVKVLAEELIAYGATVADELGGRVGRHGPADG